MFWVLTGVAAFLVTAVAVGTVWVVSSRLGRTEWVAVYDLTAAKEFVLPRLPSSVSERLGAEGVELLLAWHLDYLRSIGAAAFGRADALASAAFETEGERPPDAAPPSGGGENGGGSEAPPPLESEAPPSLSVADEALDALLRRARDAEVEIDAVDMAVVLEEAANYLAHIGAVGDEVR